MPFPLVTRSVIRRFRRSLKPWRLVVVALLPAILLVSACGGTSSSNTTASGSKAVNSSSSSAAPGVVHARAQIDRFTAIPTFTPPGPPVDVKKLAGKTIFDLPQTSEVPFLSTIISSMQAIAKQYGVNFIQYPTQGQPDQWVRGFAQATSQKPTILSLENADPGVLRPQIAQAKAAGIPVVSNQFYDLTQLGAAEPDLAAVRADRFSTAARLEADWVISDTNGKGDVIAIYNPEVASSVAMVNGLKDEFSRYCPACKVKYIVVPIVDWGTKITPDVQAALTQDPNINYVIPIYDSMSQFVIPAITAAGKVGHVHISTFNGTPFVLKDMEDGDVVRMDVGENLNWLASANMDELFRVMAGMKPVADEHTALRVFTKENVAQTGTPPSYNKGLGNAYAAGYQKLWGGS